MRNYHLLRPNNSPSHIFFPWKIIATFLTWNEDRSQTTWTVLPSSCSTYFHSKNNNTETEISKDCYDQSTTVAIVYILYCVQYLCLLRVEDVCLLPIVLLYQRAHGAACRRWTDDSTKGSCMSVWKQLKLFQYFLLDYSLMLNAFHDYMIAYIYLTMLIICMNCNN